jgi:hypothetical protein
MIDPTSLIYRESPCIVTYIIQKFKSVIDTAFYAQFPKIEGYPSVI